MKRRTKLLILLSVLCAACAVCGACAGDRLIYDDLKERGNEFRVRFDVNGGRFGSYDGVEIVDVYPLSAIEKGTKLVEPGANDRGTPGKTLSSATRSGYFLAGWYGERNLRTDAQGNMLDENGNPCGEEDQGYIYDKRFDFSEKFDPSEWTEEGENEFTLYAAWVPEFNYEIHVEGTDEVLRAEKGFDPLKTDVREIPLPSWNDETGAMDYGDFPQCLGKTFSELYSDSAMTQKVEGKMTHSGTLDLEHGISENGIAVYYSRWIDGVWFHISTAKQLIDNTRADGCYEIMDDLDFEGLTWGAGFSTGDFTGKIIGHEHTLSNITVLQVDNSRVYGGMFARITESAAIENVTFENVTFTLSAGSRMQGASFGLLTGNLAKGATVENVSVRGKFLVGNPYALAKPGAGSAAYSGYSLGLLSGNLETKGIEYEIELELPPVQSGTKTIYPCMAQVNRETGEVILSQNPDTSVQPEVSYLPE